MTLFLCILAALAFTMLIVVSSVVPYRSRLSPFETNRRKQAGEHDALLDARRETAYADIVSLQRVVQAILLVLFVLFAVGGFGWFLGIVFAIVVSLEYGMISNIAWVRRFSAKYYDKYEEKILYFIEHYFDVMKWLRTAVPVSERPEIDSREELDHMVEQSQGVLSYDEKTLIKASLTFNSRTVSEIMTPKSVVETVKREEILGPLVLDDLHKTGHSRFPVIDGDIDHVVGILYVRDVLTLDTSKQHTSKVASAMSKRVYYIREDHNLSQALSAFLSTHHHMFIVINEFRETTGIITLEDTLEALLGRRIVDEFDAHDDMRAVAARNAASKRSINRTTDSKDI